MKNYNTLYKTALAGMFALSLTMAASAQKHGGGGREFGGRAEQSRPSGGERQTFTRPEHQQTSVPRTAPVQRPQSPVVRNNQQPAQRQETRRTFPGQQPASPRPAAPPVAQNNGASSRVFHQGPPAQNNFHPAGTGTAAYRGGYNHSYAASHFSYNHYNRSPVVVNRFYFGGAYHPHPYYYRPFVAPHWGLRVNILPIGYYPFYYSNYHFFYHEGLFYRPYGSYYEVVEPPLGAYIPILPPGAYPIVINNSPYYENNGTYYERSYGGEEPYRVVGVNGLLQDDLAPATSDDGDVISNSSISPEAAAPTAPAVISVLPENYKTVSINNVIYYVSPAGEYYTKNIDDNGKVTYTQAAAQSGN